MDSLHKQIIEYFSKQSTGVVKLTEAHASHLISMVLSNESAKAKLYKKDWQNSGWILMRTVKTTDEKVNAEIIKALETAPNMDFYMFETYNAAGEFQGRIYTHDQFLF